MANPPDRPRVLGKAYAYITRGHDVLILTDLVGKLAGLRQIPGGTMEPGETPEEAVLRECFEETGLPGLKIGTYVGYLECPCPVHDDEWQLRHYFHVTADPSPTIDAWDHVEETPFDGSAPMPIHLSFEPLDGTTMNCWAEFGHYLPQLAQSLGIVVTP